MCGAQAGGWYRLVGGIVAAGESDMERLRGADVGVVCAACVGVDVEMKQADAVAPPEAVSLLFVACCGGGDTGRIVGCSCGSGDLWCNICLMLGDGGSARCSAEVRDGCSGQTTCHMWSCNAAHVGTSHVLG